MLLKDLEQMQEEIVNKCRDKLLKDLEQMTGGDRQQVPPPAGGQGLRRPRTLAGCSSTSGGGESKDGADDGESQD
uniref:Uncharacterized protein n=1 Tax=Setaria viridis TaxID=4556 RepID=A0A4U6VJZ6_SETVI|nr:hypothetical protein SEVIR_2G000175v2 [Setaria viridis]